MSVSVSAMTISHLVLSHPVQLHPFTHRRPTTFFSSLSLFLFCFLRNAAVRRRNVDCLFLSVMDHLPEVVFFGSGGALGCPILEVDVK